MTKSLPGIGGQIPGADTGYLAIVSGKVITGHTPGPWWTTDSGVRDRGGYICHTNPAQRYGGQDERFVRESAERAANKLLIAAAPAMLEALKTASWLLADISPDGLVKKQVDAAIARAQVANRPDYGPWRCFHCEEIFTERADARLHFGNSEYDKPACQYSIEHLRWMEAQHRRNCDDDSEALRTVRTLANTHEELRRKAEEEGYAKGLRDSGRPAYATIDDAPKVLNMNDKAMWVTGWNACLDAPPVKDCPKRMDK